MPSSIRILNVDILSITQEDLLDSFRKGILFTPNVDHLVKLQKDQEFYDAYQQADWIICDSRIIFFFSKLLKHSLKATISGSTFFHQFCEYHKNDPLVRIFVLGGKPQVAEKARLEINNRCGSEIVVGAYSPSFNIDKKESEMIASAINDSKANVVMVALGAPQQEKWIVKYKHLMPDVNIWMGLGATVDFEAGVKKRAPIFVQKIGMEWLYRFFKEPKRLFKRYFVDDMKFFWYYTKQMFKCYHNPFEQ